MSVGSAVLVTVDIKADRIDDFLKVRCEIPELEMGGWKRRKCATVVCQVVNCAQRKQHKFIQSIHFKKITPQGGKTSPLFRR